MRPNPISILETKSPKLHSFFAKRHPSHLNFAQLAFELAVSNDGLMEFGFKRKPGINFNPRPARIPLIADQFNNKFESNFYVACILTTISTEVLISQICEFGLLFNEKIHRYLYNFTNNRRSIESNEIKFSNSTESIYLNLFNFLDRLRHSHLADKPESEYCINNFDLYLKKIPKDQSKLANVFQTWHKRAQINLDNTNFK